MNGSDFIAQIACSAQVLGISGGVGLAEVTAKLGAGDVEEVHGRRKGRRLLRRDCGLFEVTFDGEPEWLSVWITMEVHRAASRPELRKEAIDRFGLQLARYTPWEQVKDRMSREVDLSRLEECEFQPGYRSYSVNEGKSIIRVVSDNSAVRGDFPVMAMSGERK